MNCSACSAAAQGSNNNTGGDNLLIQESVVHLLVLKTNFAFQVYVKHLHRSHTKITSGRA